jgi:prefoldin subunit 5
MYNTDLLLKYLDATLATYKKRMKHLKDASETLAKTLEKHYKHTQHPNKILAIYV